MSLVSKRVHPFTNNSVYIDSNNNKNKKNKMKNVHFSNDAPLVISTDQMSSEEMGNYWYNRSDLIRFRNLARSEAGSIRQYANHPDKNLFKAYKATTKGNKESAVMFLQLWCSSPNEYSCFRGLETMFLKGTLEDLEKDRQISIASVLRVQEELLTKGSNNNNNEELIKEVYVKACENSKNFYYAMGLADSMMDFNNGKDKLPIMKRRSIVKRFSRTLRTSISRQA